MKFNCCVLLIAPFFAIAANAQTVINQPQLAKLVATFHGIESQLGQIGATVGENTDAVRSLSADAGNVANELQANIQQALANVRTLNGALLAVAQTFSGSEDTAAGAFGRK
jgi:ABC-type transporter Mla subunit MlaD